MDSILLGDALNSLTVSTKMLYYSESRGCESELAAVYPVYPP